MTHRIYKYPVRITDVFSIDMPAGAQLLRAMAQGDSPQLWALVDPERRTDRRYFRLVGTGHPIDDATAERLKYVDTFMLEDGALVFHLFETPVPSNSEEQGK